MLDDTLCIKHDISRLITEGLVIRLDPTPPLRISRALELKDLPVLGVLGALPTVGAAPASPSADLGRADGRQTEEQCTETPLRQDECRRQK